MAVVVEIGLVSFVGEKANTNKTLLGLKCGFKNADSTLFSPFLLFWQESSVIIMFSSYRFCKSDQTAFRSELLLALERPHCT